MTDPSSIDLETASPAAGMGEVFVAPASFFQRRLFTLDRLFPGQATYNVPVALSVAGPLDVDRLTAALAALTARHETLRTSFAAGDDQEPVQRIEEELAPRVTRIDLGAFPAAGREAEAARLLDLHAAAPFDLARAPLLHTLIVRLERDRFDLLFNLHHNVIDGWTADLLVRELFEIYDARGAGRPPALPELPLQYADFAAWQREWLVGEALEKRLAPWRARLADVPVTLDLPLDRPRPEIGSGRGGVSPLAFPAASAARLRDLARASGATLFMATLAAYAAFLSRITGQTDLIVGTPVSGRNRPELETILGPIVNTLPLRCRLAGDPGFAGLLAAVQGVVVEAFSNQDLPFEKMVEELRPERRLAVNPLFQALLVYEQPPAPGHRIGDLALSPLVLHSGTAKVDLSLYLSEDAAGAGGGMSGFWEWNADLFDAVTIARFSALFERLLEAAVARPEEPISRLPLLAPAEAQQILLEWNDTAAALPRQSLPALFAEQVALRPDAVALAADEGQLSYGELDRRAGRLARRLRRLGVGVESRVGLVAHRSLEMVAAVLGILRAGGTYAPLDPAFPRERLALLLADLAPAAVAGPRHLLAELPGTAPRLAWDEPAAPGLAADEETGSEIDSGIGPESLAYVLYTSGSTGVPKGVEVPHAAVVRLVRQAGFLPFGPDEVFLQAAPLAFDASTLELWGPLLNGGRLALYPPGPWALAELAAAVERHGATVLWLTAGLFHLAAEAGFPGLAALRWLLAGGDVLLPAAVERAAADLPATALVNGYGPTENTTFSTTWNRRWNRRQGQEAGAVPIGRPIGNSLAYVLDARLAPLPVGVVGELCVGGRGLARGYLGRPELTAERFVPAPFAAFAAEAGGRLYRTGDLARQTGDGTLEFLGRRDTQVKVRGVRIELGEVESALLGHPGVKEGAVAAVGTGAGDRRLVAYYVPSAGEAAADPAGLAAHLRRLLPDALVPQAFVELAALPLLASGKVDRRALPAPPWEGEKSAPAALPRTPLEESLVALWEEVLDTSGLGLDDDFFAAGGHSLLALVLLARIRRDLGAELPLSTLFLHPTVAGLAAEIAGLAGGGGRVAGGPAAGGSPIRPVPRDGPLPMSAAQLRQWFLAELEPGTTAFNVPLTAELRGPLEIPVLAACLAEIVRRQESLRTTFTAAGGRPRPVIAAPWVPALPLVDLGALAGTGRAAEARRRVQELGGHIFDLERGPLLDLALFRLAPAEHLLFVDVHHIVFDGWSWGVFLRELAALYAAAARGRPSPLPELAIQYVDYAAWQQEWLAGEAGRRQGEFWRERLAGAPGLLPLPTDRPRPAIQTYHGAEAVLVLPPGPAAALRAFGAADGATLFMTLLAGFQLWLARATRQEDVNVGTFVANRRWPEVEPLLGFFLNTLVLRGDVSGTPTGGELLARVRDTTVAAFENQDFPFERLLDELGIERDPSRTPLFQVLLMLQNFALSAIELPGDPGLTLAPADLFRTERAHFDLSLVAGEEGGSLFIQAQYNRHLFDATTIRRFLGQLETLLAALVAEPGRAVGELPWLSPAESQQVAIEWADGGWPEPAAAALPRPLLAARAARAADALAVVAGERALSYGELERRLGRVAGRLHGLGIGPESRVAIALPRSPEMVIGVLAILEAGAGYLPLDPDLPAERCALLLEDSRPAALLCLGAPPPGAAGFAGPVVRLDAPGEMAEMPHPAIPPPAPDNLAYVLYTSGSTGRPKGVEGLHGALGRFLAAALPTYGLAAADRVLQFASLSFDTSLEEILPCLAAGGTLVLRDDEMIASPARFLAACAELAITVLDLPTAYWHVLAAALAAGGPVLPPALRLVILGGERALPERVATWLETVGPYPRLFNTYGPTEATIVCASGPLGEPADAGNGGSVPLGRPWGGARLRLMDRRLRPVPPGVAGEICIAGGLLARGYLGRPELTAAAFVPSTLGGPGERLYRSGDLARHRGDGRLEFLGRVDDQVKIRGFRIEPSEIAAVLARHPAVAQAVVVAREAAPGELRLAAYFVAAGGAAPAAGELREFLKARLPAYMVPADLVALPALPTGATGKVDFAALPAPEGGEGGAYAPPETAIEELLVEIWQEVLSRERIGIHDNLFELGGHSLLIPQITSRIEEALQVPVPMRALFDAPTVAELAVVVEDALLAEIENLTDEEAGGLLRESALAG